MKQGDCTAIVNDILYIIRGQYREYCDRYGKYPTSVAVGIDLYRYLMVEHTRVIRKPDGKLTLMGMEIHRSLTEGLIMVGSEILYNPEDGDKANE